MDSKTFYIPEASVSLPTMNGVGSAPSPDNQRADEEIKVEPIEHLTVRQFRVSYPDGHVGFVSASDVKEVDEATAAIMAKEYATRQFLEGRHKQQEAGESKTSLYLFHGRDGNSYLGFGQDAAEAACILEAEYPGCLSLADCFPVQAGGLLKLRKCGGKYVLDEVMIGEKDERTGSCVKHVSSRKKTGVFNRGIGYGRKNKRKKVK